jgi:uncharacterized phiE125 gp8 family phage protein
MSNTAVPVTIEEMKTHLRVTHSDDDQYITALTLAATTWAEQFQRRVYIKRSMVMQLDRFPGGNGIIRPVYSPLDSVTSIQYVDSAGATQTVDSDDYRVDTVTEPGRIAPAFSKVWPVTRSVIGAVTVTYEAGYESIGAVPDHIKHAVKLIVGHFYENREETTEVKLEKIPHGAATLLWQDRMF